ncbi:EF-hand calcium-binding domain-containing protein 12 [Candoia aspera]|uniref:EF-hand calcium-binding domain-containing protein 12 n=1 Tax=Candoia aspera TaxID=51853 RepID=UPI002FD7D332
MSYYLLHYCCAAINPRPIPKRVTSRRNSRSLAGCRRANGRHKIDTDGLLLCDTTFDLLPLRQSAAREPACCLGARQNQILPSGLMVLRKPRAGNRCEVLSPRSCERRGVFKRWRKENGKSDSTSNEDLCKEESLDGILSHCFKQYKLRNAYPYFSLKLKANRFGPPKSRRRILIAPPMSGVASSSRKPQPPVPSDVKQVQDLTVLPEDQDSTSTEESDLLKLEAWIEERKQLHYLLDNCVNLEEWLSEKKAVTLQEESILRKIKEEREEKKAKIQADLLALHSVKEVPKSEPLKSTPLIHAPYPPSIITLQNLLHKQKLKLMDLFKKADKSRTMKFKRTDFLRIIQETKVPISKTDLEEIIVYLTVSKKGHIITADDLAECQRIWMDNVRENWKQPKQEPLPMVKTASTTAKGDLTHHTKPSVTSYVACQPKSNHLQVPPVNTEPDRMHLTYNQMEVAGKRYKEMRRRLRRKTNPLAFAEQCRLVRSGDPVVDGHCLPSTLEGEMGELVDQHRLACHYVYVQCVKLCEKYGIPISEKVLKRGLLYPGDRLLRLGKNVRKLRQPGGHGDTFAHSLRESFDGESPSKVEKRSGQGVSEDHCHSSLAFSKSNTSKKHQFGESWSDFSLLIPVYRFVCLFLSSRKPKPVAIKKQVKKQALTCRWGSFKEFKQLMSKHSKKILPPPEIWNEKFLDDSLLESPDVLAKQYVERELRRMFCLLNPLTNPNNFWPGHLLDKLCLCLPESRQDGSEVLFSRVSHTRPACPGIYYPHRNWPVSNRGYMTFGDSESRKHYYYI